MCIWKIFISTVSLFFLLVKMCKDDLQQLEHYVETLRPDYDNKMSETGEVETIHLGTDFKSHLVSIIMMYY